MAVEAYELKTELLWFHGLLGLQESQVTNKMQNVEKIIYFLKRIVMKLISPEIYFFLHGFNEIYSY